MLYTLFCYFWNNSIFTTYVSTCQRCNNRASFAMETEDNKKKTQSYTSRENCSQENFILPGIYHICIIVVDISYKYRVVLSKGASVFQKQEK